MSIDIRHAAISFGWIDAEDDNHRLWLVPLGPLTINGGLVADTFSASVPASEYAKLPSIKTNLLGRLELWDTAAPSDDLEVDADVVWQNWTPVEIEIERVGVVAGAESNSVISWRVTFADHRLAWMQPRGGILRDGIGNADPSSLINNETLAQACLDAMGASSTAPSTLNDIAPIRELDWTFAHAPTELARILEHTAHCFCPQPVGLGNLQPINTGTLPSFDSADVVHDITFAALDRRPQAVVISSAPTPVVHTWTDAASDPAPPAWTFVAQDPADNYEWKPLASITAIGADPQQALRDGLPGASDEHRAQLLNQMYRCIRIDQDVYPAGQASLLREAEDADSNRVPPYIKLEVALQRQDGAWVDTEARLPASQVIAEAGVLQFEQRLVTVGGEAGDLDVAAVAITEADLKPTFSIEAWSSDKRVTAVWGFSLLSGTPNALSESTALSYLSGYRPTVAVLNYPELRRVVINGGASSNDATLATAAESYAAAFLAAESANAREIRLRGFADVGISGRIASIVYDFATLTTTLSIDSWARPSTAPGRASAGAGIGDELPDGSVVKPRGRQPQQARQRAHRTATRSGQISDRTPIQPASPAPTGPTGLRVVFVEIVAAGDELGIYTGKLRSGRLATTPGALNAADLGELAASVNAEVWCLADIQFGYNSLAAGDVVAAVAGSTVEGDSIVRCVTWGTPFSQAVLCRIEQTGGSAGNATTACSYTYKARTPDWNGSTYDAQGKELGTTLTPIKPRPTVGAMKIQSGSTGWGIGRWSSAGTFQLLDAFEVLDAEACG